MIPGISTITTPSPPPPSGPAPDGAPDGAAFQDVLGRQDGLAAEGAGDATPVEPPPMALATPVATPITTSAATPVATPAAIPSAAASTDAAPEPDPHHPIPAASPAIAVLAGASPVAPPPDTAPQPAPQPAPERAPEATAPIPPPRRPPAPGSAESAVRFRAAPADADPTRPDISPPDLTLPAPLPLQTDRAPVKSVEPSPLPPTLAPQIVQTVHHAATDTIELTLNPEELGRLRFELTRNGEHMHIALTADRPETLDLLRRNADALLAEFRQAGYGGASLSFGQSGQGGAGQHPAQPPPPVAPQQPLPQTASPPEPPPPASGLDLRL